MKDTAINIGHSLFEILISIPSGIYPEWRLLAQRAVQFLMWGGGGWGRNFFTVLPEAIPFSFTPVACEGFSFSTSPPTFSNLFFWGGGMVIIAILTGVR